MKEDEFFQDNCWQFYRPFKDPGSKLFGDLTFLDFQTHIRDSLDFELFLSELRQRRRFGLWGF
ncbi:hypothetical protein V2J09_005680 [Rumex salicifolius]